MYSNMIFRRSCLQHVGRNQRPPVCQINLVPPCITSASNRGTEPMYYPGAEEDLEVTQSAFHRAFEDAMPIPAKVPGLQQFAASIWDRRKRIPSRQDPLLTLFDEFDRDNDGILSSDEIAEALRSRGVNEISTAQVQWLINVFEESKACALPSFKQVVTRQQWPDFVFSLTVADMHAHADPSKSLDSE
ncbi:hypothetical protein CEUSTIGMA_g10639.t1 [Chlamydomonas eustigma]|uniref:EF-hand domain-containing protein n=1 Tax=Chlamydomonas eustigma TaxID=1157962 RepID=A0A250XJK5_9CHLO|nr:hypothetical protein CEUSTIGMA_g10639.t1 [Chlamydomonas eustigma]|eukprot:GAX83213.1 hypothetical protein CEUSTIGMA_g10639.t1 [Chlamydomonas eustigma]